MKIHNQLPLFLECLSRWKTLPDESVFNREYAQPLSETTQGFFDDFYSVLLELDWNEYRNHALKLDANHEDYRLRKHITQIEKLFGFKLEGEAFLIGAFAAMDGYARFDRGTHRVFLGVDESFNKGQYLDILVTHELTHVARESRPEVWSGFGLNPKMTQNEFTENQPVIEHLMGEGFSCVVSEILNPNEPEWAYVYQSEETLKTLLKHHKDLSRIIKNEIRKPDGDYGSLYGIRPIYGHYYWAYRWVKDLLHNHFKNDAKAMVAHCSKDLISLALSFEL